MNGLLLKDLYNLKGSIAFIIVLTVMFAIVFSWNSLESIILVSTITMTTVINGSFSFDHTNGWNAHAVSIGVPRDSIVKSKFEFGLIFILVGLVFGIVLALLLESFFGYSVTIGWIISSALVSFGVGLISTSVICVVNYHVSPDKAQIVSILCTSISVAGSVIIGSLISELTNGIPFSASITVPTLGIAMFALMYVKSQRKFAHSDL
ncbi:MAG: ABC-2 transporter permease [Candidatus Methanomethylophilaceae archaeon]